MATGDKKRALMASDINDAQGSYGVLGMDKKGVANGVAELGSDGKVPSSQLPASSGPSPYTSTPEMDGIGAAGSSDNYARGDHVHPSDTSKLGTGGDGSNVTAAFTVASSRTNIATGEKLSVIFGKIAKWFTDLGTAAFRAATSSITQSSTDLVESGAVYTGLADKQAKVTASGILKGDGSGGVSAAVAGTDYQTPLTAGTDYATPAAVTAAQQISAPTLVSPATENIAAGKYRVYNNLLYQLSSAISSGETASSFESKLTAVPEGGLNALKAALDTLSTKALSVTLNSTDGFYAEAGPLAYYSENSDGHGFGIITGYVKCVNALTGGTEYTIGTIGKNVGAVRCIGYAPLASKVEIANNQNAILFTPSSNIGAFSEFYIMLPFVF